MPLRATDHLVFFECCQCARLSVTECDLMGIGSDLRVEGLDRVQDEVRENCYFHAIALRDYRSSVGVSLGASRKEACTLTEALSNLFAK